MNLFNKNLYRAILTAILFSAFIYMEEFSLQSTILETLFGFGAIYLILTLSRKELSIAGFLIGILWFFWIGFSMRYYGFPYLIPFVILFFGAVYSLHFYLIGYWSNIWIRASLLILVNLLEPFGFNWFKPQIIFINTYFGTSIFEFALIVFGIALLIYNRENKRVLFQFLPIFLFVLAVAKPIDKTEEPHLKIKVVETKVKQDEKWKKEKQLDIVRMNIREIKKAIDEEYDMVIIPESTFPLFINKRADVIRVLSDLSHEITIWTGGLLSEGGNYYNSAYLFQNGEFKTAKKVVLVPFGEYIPLPKFLSTWINEIFFDGVQDFTSASKPTDFNISGELFRSAICYEASSKELYENSPKFMIAISNNGWFLPSIEPSLQKLLIQHYSNINGVTIFHSANMRGAGVIFPKKEVRFLF